MMLDTLLASLAVCAVGLFWSWLVNANARYGSPAEVIASIFSMMFVVIASVCILFYAYGVLV